MQNNLNRVGVATNFVLCRIQPSKERVHPAYEYAGDEDTAREAPEKINKDDFYVRLLELFSSNTKLNNTGQQKGIQHHESTTTGKSVPVAVLVMSNLVDVETSF